MDSDNESYFEESSSEDEQEVAGPLHIKLELNLEEVPESRSPGPPSPAPAPVAQIPVDNIAFVWELPDDGTNLISFYTRADVLELKEWSITTRQRPNEEGYVVEEPIIPQNFIAFLVEYHGTQWEMNILRSTAEPLFAQMLVYIAGYARLTSHNKRIFRQWFGTWSAEVKREQLRLLAESGGFLRGLFSPRRPLNCSLLCGFLLWNCTTNKIFFWLFDRFL